MELLEQHFDTAFAAPDGIKKLRELILTLAMQGKLVPQDPNDPPASELLKDIETEKKRLVKEGKIKAPKPLAPISAEEIPYELPEGWEWVRFYEITSQITDGTHHTPTYIEEGIPFLSVKDMSSGWLNFSETRFISHKEHQELIKRCHPQNGDLLLTKVGTTGIPVLVSDDREFSIFVSVALIKFPKHLLSGRFLSWLIKSPLVKKQSEDGTEGVGNKNLVLRKIANFLLPLPPLPEQQRIVAKIDQLMARCDELERLRAGQEDRRLTVHAAAIQQLLNIAEPEQHQRAKDFLAQHFGELYTVQANVTELRKAILQLAVMGKLVPQDPNDPPASELLKDIETEKKRLVKEGKIKAPKPLPPISAEEIPYELPEGWEWVRFFSVNVVKSELVSAKDFPDENQVAPDSIEKGNGRLLFHRTVAESGAIGPNNKFYKGQILYSKIRPSLNKVLIAPYDGLCSADMYPIETYTNSEYMLKTMLSEIFLAQVRVAENRIKMPKLNLESLGQFIFPLPPLPEQHRIVAKIDQLMALCDELEAQIIASKRQQSALLDAVMAQV